MNPETWQSVQQNHTHLSASQRAAVEQTLATRDKIVGLEGVAGAGKTTSLSAIREAAEREGYQVIGLAPTSRATHKLAESGIESQTLQRQLIRNEAPNDWPETDFRYRRIESYQYEANERILPSPADAGPSAFGWRYAAT